MKKFIRNINGFTIVELIVAGAISITAIGVGFTVLQIALKGNKIEETQSGLSGRLNDTLDFILDEVKVGKRIIDTEMDIKSFNSNCKYPDSGEFLFGIRLPDQALVKGDYNPEGDVFNLNTIECPIVYTLRPSENNEDMPYSLIRYGPQYDEKGFYISPSYKEFQETVLLDGITANQEYEKIICPLDWNDIKTIKGISFCIDKFKKSIEIQIESEVSYSYDSKNNLKSVASTGGFNLIQDETQVNLTPSSTTNSDAPICLGVSCCWMGVCLKSNKITYMIDNSYFMNEEYVNHPNGLIINGNWEGIDDPRYIEARINGKSLIEFAKTSLKAHIDKLPTSDTDSVGEKVYIQVIALNNSSKYLFDEPRGPRELTLDNKVRAKDFISLELLAAKENNEIDPWEDICSALELDSVEQIILLSGSIPSTIEGNCVGESGNYAEIINDYNRIKRSKTVAGALIIDSISLFHNFCEESKNYNENNWLGMISSGEESVCTYIK